VRIAAEITKSMIGPTERQALRRHPVFAKCLSQKFVEDLRTAEGFECSVKSQRSIAKGLTQSGDELASEDRTEDPYRQKEAMTRSNPALMVWGKAAGRYDAVNVRMMLQLLIPGVEHAEEADFGPEMTGIAGHFEQRFRTGSEQQIIDHLLVLQGQRSHFVGQREDHMRIACGQEFAPSGGEPAVACACLALRAVPVATRVEGDGPMSAGGAFVDVTAERGSATAFNGREHLQVCPAQGWTVSLNKARSCATDNIGHLERRPWHLLS